MPKLYPLDDYICAVEELARRHGLFAKPYQGKKNAVGFWIFQGEDSREPIEQWVIHTTHGKWKSRKVWSKEDLKKPARHIKDAT